MRLLVAKMHRNVSSFAAITFLFMLTLAFSQPETQTQTLTLLALKSAVSLDPTRVLSTWVPSDPSPCSWHGVSCSASGEVTSLSLPYLQLHGYLPSVLSLLSSLQVLNLSNNNLTGHLPNELGNLTALTHLDLSSNSFTGPLPPSLARLSNLEGVLNLSFNMFFGEVPIEYGQLPVTVSLDLRNNHLSGEVPKVGSLVNQGPTAFSGNPGLCGFPLKVDCANNGLYPGFGPQVEPDVIEPEPRVPVSSKKKVGPAITAMILVGILFAAFVSVAVLQWQFRKKRGGEGEKTKKKDVDVCVVEEERREGRAGEIYVTIDEEFTLELEELLRASAYVVGKSKSGIVYKVVVGRGPAVAVRRLSEGDECEGEGDEWKKRRIFEAEAMAIGRANHPNVVRLRAYYYAPDEKLLIYDYISNGTLHSALHGGQQNPTSEPLPWATRLSILQGAARGLAFLHECTPRKYIHGNIKSTKILLDDDLRPYVSGFGLTRLLSGTQKFTHSLSKKSASSIPTTSNYSSSNNNATLEYLAPEARVPHTPITQKCDVYSFGIVMLEALTGRLPSGGLEEFVRKAFKEEGALSDIVDPALLHEVHAKKQVLAVFHVALGCTELDPEFRPRMKAVSENLDRIYCTNI